MNMKSDRQCSGDSSPGSYWCLEAFVKSENVTRWHVYLCSSGRVFVKSCRHSLSRQSAWVPTRASGLGSWMYHCMSPCTSPLRCCHNEGSWSEEQWPASVSEFPLTCSTVLNVISKVYHRVILSMLSPPSPPPSSSSSSSFLPSSSLQVKLHLFIMMWDVQLILGSEMKNTFRHFSTFWVLHSCLLTFFFCQLAVYISYTTKDV